MNQFHELLAVQLQSRLYGILVDFLLGVRKDECRVRTLGVQEREFVHANQQQGGGRAVSGPQP